MKKGLYIHSANEIDVINLYFTADTVTLRTFQKINSAQEMNAIEKRRNIGVDMAEVYRQSQRNNEQDRNRPQQEGQGDENREANRQAEVEEIAKRFDTVRKSALSQTALIKDAANLQGKYVLIDKNLYRVAKQTTFRLDKQIWSPYSEVCMSLMKNSGRYPERHLLAFFDRNAQTINGHESFSQFHKKFRLSDSYIAFRWIVLPGASLLTAPVIASPIQRLITNLDLGEEVKAVADRQVSVKELQDTEKAIPRPTPPLP